MTNQKIILFDFDGVIADSFELAFEIHKTICPRMTEHEYRRLFEGNINNWEKTMDVHALKCREDRDFFAEYTPRMKKEVRIVPGIKDVIIELGKKYTLVVISSTITSPIQEFMDKYHIADYFEHIMGNDVHEQKTEKIRMVFEDYRVEAKNCIFITDTLGDMREAETMNIGSIGVAWGFHAPKTLQRGNPFRIVKQPYDILVAVSEYFDTADLC